MRTATVAQTRELTIEELDLVSGGKWYTSTRDGFEFYYNDVSGQVTICAGNACWQNK